MAKTGTPAAAMAAASWSWVEKMLHEAQRTSAPRACRVSISTAVWMVMCSEPQMRAPFSGLSLPNSAHDHPDRGADRDPAGPGRRRALGLVQHLLDPGPRRRRHRGYRHEIGSAHVR